MSEIDYLNDPLLDSPEKPVRAPRTPLMDRVASTLSRIQAFVEETGAAPVSAPGRSVRERMLANDLAGLRCWKDALPTLRALDTHRIIFEETGPADDLDELLLGSSSDIFEVRKELQPRATPDYVADRRPCLDFDRFETMFKDLRNDLDAGIRRPVPFHQERIEVGESFILKNQILHVVSAHDETTSGGTTVVRLRVVYADAMESDLLASSLTRRLYEDKTSRRIGANTSGPLFEGVETGFVYLVRSLSSQIHVDGLLKIGTTTGLVEDRIARAERQGAFLFAPVEIVETHSFKGFSAKAFEAAIHQVLNRFNVPLQVVGPDGRTFKANEWFNVDVDTVAEVIERLKNGA